MYLRYPTEVNGPVTLVASFRKHWKTAVVLLVVGVVLFIIRQLYRGVWGLVFLSDLLFTVAMVYLIWGLIHTIGNMDMFASLIWGTKCLVRLIRGKQDSSQRMRDGYLEYVQSRRRHTDVPMLMVLAAGFFILSLLASLPVL